MQEAYANGVCWFTAWTDLGRFFKGMARGTCLFPYRRALAGCQVCFKIQNHERFSKKLVTREFQQGKFTAGGYFSSSLAKPYTDENIISYCKRTVQPHLQGVIFDSTYKVPVPVKFKVLREAEKKILSYNLRH